jgi:hypothetical protein
MATAPATSVPNESHLRETIGSSRHGGSSLTAGHLCVSRDRRSLILITYHIVECGPLLCSTAKSASDWGLWVVMSVA